MIHLEIVRSLAAFEALEQPWRRLEASLDSPYVFETYDWYAAWLRHYGGDESLHVVAAYEQDALVAVFPFRETAGARPALALLQNDYSPEAGIPAMPERSTAAWNAFLDHVFASDAPWRCLRIDELRHSASAQAALQHAVGERGLHAYEDFTYYAPCLDVGALEHWSDGLEPSTRKLVLRDLRRCEQDHAISYECIEDAAAFDAALGELRAVSQASWQGEDGTGTFANDRNRAFYADLCRRMAAAGNLRIQVVRHRGDAVAYELALRDGDVLYGLKQEYDPAHRRGGPGNIAWGTLLERECAAGLQRMNNCCPSSPHKDRWSDHREPHSNWHVYRAGLKGHGDFLRLQGPRALAKAAVCRDRIRYH